MSEYNPGQKSVPNTDSNPAPSNDSQQKTPDASSAVSSATVGVTVGSMMSISLGVIVHLIFSYGAAKLSYDMFGSVGWAVLDFIFSWIYYPYYALFLNKPTGPPALGIVGARRRR